MYIPTHFYAHKHIRMNTRSLCLVWQIKLRFVLFQWCFQQIWCAFIQYSIYLLKFTETFSCSEISLIERLCDDVWLYHSGNVHLNSVHILMCVCVCACFLISSSLLFATTLFIGKETKTWANKTKGREKVNSRWVRTISDEREKKTALVWLQKKEANNKNTIWTMMSRDL